MTTEHVGAQAVSKRWVVGVCHASMSFEMAMRPGVAGDTS
jgi:hypothetical protein